MKKNVFKETGREFSRSQLLTLTGLTRSSFQTLVDNRVINKGVASPLYKLSEVVYFRLIRLLRYEFSMQDIREKVLDVCEFYKDDLLNYNYASISLNTGKPERMVFCEINDEDVRKHLQGKFMCVDRKTDYATFGEMSHEYNVWINISEMVDDLFISAYDHEIDNIDLKFKPYFDRINAYEGKMLEQKVLNKITCKNKR